MYKACFIQIITLSCIFDLDGTLANTLESIAYFANSALIECGYQSIEVSKYKYLVGNGANRLMHNMLDTVCGKGGNLEEDINKLRNIYDKLYESNPTYIVKDYSGIKETVKELKSIGIKTAVLSQYK